MPTTNLAMYRLLTRLGATEAEAEAASSVEHLVTKDDLRHGIGVLRADLLKWGIGLLFIGLVMQTALIIFALTRYCGR